MVWFQCEDCGENLRKPKLPNHFRICSAYKLSCIDCGEMFTQQTVQGHMQCISEAEKYGPKNQANSTQKSQIKEAKPKPHLDIDINVGLSTQPPWFCSLCNTSTTSKQTLLLHADGKKHRNKAKAFHASKNQNEGPRNTDDVSSLPMIDSSEKMRAGIKEVRARGEDLPRKKAKIEEFDELASNGMADGEVIQSHEVVAESNRKSSDCPQSVESDHSSDASRNCDKGSSDRKIKWKKMIISVLKSDPKRVLKMKKLKKLVTKSLLESGITETKDEIRRALKEKLTSSSRFNINGKYIHLNQKAKSE